nr:EOG090X00WU [Lepidurus arcticus]
MKSILMVAEKPLLAETIAKILSGKNYKHRKGFNGSCSVYEWTGTFKGEPAFFRMTSVCGHVMSLDFTEKYNNWNTVDPVELFGCRAVKKEATPKLRMPSFLAHEAKGCNYLVLWLDCDKEGENICFEVIEAVKPVMDVSETNLRNVFRAKFSSVADQAIKEAMRNLVAPDLNESLSVDARQELDLRIGCAFTRFQTKFFQGKYGDIDSNLISYGPCQTPTLGFCVRRHDIIQTFKPENFWTLQCTVMVDNHTLALSWRRERVFEQEVATAFYSTIQNCKQARVTSVSKKEKQKQKPAALNTVELMRVASSNLNMSPHHAMQIAERLYTQGYISYPRTETTQYPDQFDFREVIMEQQGNIEVREHVQILLQQGFKKPRSGQDVGDHPPITPLKLATNRELDSDSWRIYDYIVRHFLATVSADCVYLSTEVEFLVGTEYFQVSGKRVVTPGFIALINPGWGKQDDLVPDLKAQQLVSVEQVRVAQRQTSPPDYLTEAELITLMEKHGIGTDASIPVHINNISQRNYVQVVNGRRLVPTALGIALVHGYHKIDPQLVLPTMRSEVEKQLNLIAKGKANFQDLLTHTLGIFRLKFVYFEKNISQMDNLFEDTFSSLTDSGRNFSRCGKCRRYLKLVAARPARLHCSHCDETYALPQNGNFKLYNELKCPLDEFELLVWTSGTRGKSFVFCPCCYNAPPFRDMEKSTPCNACTHPTCPHGLSKNGVASCGECPKGTLYLDQTSFPKWKLVCNKCEVTVNLTIDAQKILVTEDCCEECDARLLRIETKPQESGKLADGKTQLTGCIFCDSDLSHVAEKGYATFTRRQFRRPMEHIGLEEIPCQMTPTTTKSIPTPLLLIGLLGTLLFATEVNSMALYGISEDALNITPPLRLNNQGRDFWTWLNLQHLYPNTHEADSVNSIPAEAYSSDSTPNVFIPLSQKRQSRLCGSRLADTVRAVCFGKFNGKRAYNEVEVQGNSDDPSKDIMNWNRMKRGLVDECCLRSCSVRQMQAYCAS